jgi:hypothetical protein
VSRTFSPLTNTFSQYSLSHIRCLSAFFVQPHGLAHNFLSHLKWLNDVDRVLHLHLHSNAYFFLILFIHGVWQKQEQKFLSLSLSLAREREKIVLDVFKKKKLFFLSHTQFIALGSSSWKNNTTTAIRTRRDREREKFFFSVRRKERNEVKEENNK